MMKLSMIKVLIKSLSLIWLEIILLSHLSKGKKISSREIYGKQKSSKCAQVRNNPALHNPLKKRSGADQLTTHQPTTQLTREGMNICMLKMCGVNVDYMMMNISVE